MVFVDLNDELNRLSTFSNDWPHAFINPKELAKTGFYYIGPHDQVKCYICQIQVSSWEMGDDEITEHIRWSPCCPLVRLCRPMVNERQKCKRYASNALDAIEPASKRLRLNVNDDL